MDVWFKEVVNRIRTDEDPIELNQYRLVPEKRAAHLAVLFRGICSRKWKRDPRVRLYRQTGPFCTQ